MARRILVVDDDTAVAAAVSTMLNLLGYQVVSATAPDKALSICDHSEIPFDLLITDFFMPKMNGQELAELARTTHPNLKVLYMTGDKDMVKSLQEKGLAYLSKPFHLQDLDAAVRFTLKRGA
jgi:DNA-binding NtrC family response regulator